VKRVGFDLKCSECGEREYFGWMSDVGEKVF